mmetsp:Transcript_25209/g.87943  ORF Transcript_25209/g.87943 Transcript_25209/m.87943 type:complete len:219 (+) Transcript_25209:2512-3168(+)
MMRITILPPVARCSSPASTPSAPRSALSKPKMVTSHSYSESSTSSTEKPSVAGSALLIIFSSARRRLLACGVPRAGRLVVYATAPLRFASSFASSRNSLVSRTVSSASHSGCGHLSSPPIPSLTPRITKPLTHARWPLWLHSSRMYRSAIAVSPWHTMHSMRRAAASASANSAASLRAISSSALNGAPPPAPSPAPPPPPPLPPEPAALGGVPSHPPA